MVGTNRVISVVCGFLLWYFMVLLGTFPLVYKEKSMLERDIERKFKKGIKAKGGLALKFISPGWSGAPDRLILMPGGKASFAEMKASGKTLRPLQKKRKAELEALGFVVEVIDYEI